MKPNIKLTPINIIWEKIPFEFDFSSIKTKMEETDYGLYQISGHHPAYGSESLLYIGVARMQNFGIRLNKRYEFIESYSRPTSIRIGRISINKDEIENHDEIENYDEYVNSWGELMLIAEKILIKSHSPALNKQEIGGLISSDFIKEKGHYIIINWGEFGQLLPEVSTLRASYTFWEYNQLLSNSEYNRVVEKLAK